jgi:hypothetical protein
LSGGRLLWKQWWTFRFHKMQGISWVAENWLASWERLCSMELGSWLVPFLKMKNSKFLEHCALCLALLTSTHSTVIFWTCWPIFKKRVMNIMPLVNTLFHTFWFPVIMDGYMVDIRILETGAAVKPLPCMSWHDEQ